MATKKHPRSAIILYGSETGNAQDVAEELGSMAERLHFMTQVLEMNSVAATSLASYTFVVFVISTTGQGDLPGNARKFWKTLLLKKLPEAFLNGVEFALFGLGDSSYPKFNWAARKLHKRLLQLGANEIYPIGEADQRHPEGLEGTSIPWATDFRKHLLDRYPLSPGQGPIPDDVQLPPKWVLQVKDVDWLESTGPPGQQQQQPQRVRRQLDYDVRPLPDTFTATLVRNERVTTADHWQDVRHISLTTPEPLTYGPGDMLNITPKNLPDDVQILINLMNWNEHADKPVSLIFNNNINDNKNNANDNTLPPPQPPVPNLQNHPNLTLRTLISDYFDLRGIPRRSFFSTIAHYTTDSMQKERLLEFTNPVFVDEFWDYTTRPRRSILEVLHEFHTVRIPWEHVPSVFPVIRGRQFSIASGGILKKARRPQKQQQDTTKERETTRPTDQKEEKEEEEEKEETNFDLLIAIVKYQTIIKRIREGICTRFLSVLQPGSTLRVQLQRGSLAPSPQQLIGPTILIGPGTGIAPLRSMLWEKAAIVEAYKQRLQVAHSQAQSQNEDGGDMPLQIPATTLLFGARNRSSDFFFHAEYQLLTPLINLALHTAFSRDQRGKVYVQDRVRENFAAFYTILCELGGSVFVCGSSGRMPEAVREALVECFQYGGGFGRGEAEEYLVGMERSGRYKQETW